MYPSALVLGILLVHKVARDGVLVTVAATHDLTDGRGGVGAGDPHRVVRDDPHRVNKRQTDATDATMIPKVFVLASGQAKRFHFFLPFLFC